MRFSWKAGAAVVLAATALGLSGCVAFNGPIRGKQISADEVKVKFKLCNDVETSCNEEAMKRQRGDSETHVLLGIRAPKGTDMPKDFSPKDINVLFEGSGSYAAELNAKAPRKDNEKWFGYISEDIADLDADKARFKLILGLPNYPGDTFKFRPVVGYTNGAHEDTVVCAEDPRDPFNDPDTEFVCIDDPDENPELKKSIKVELD